MESKSTGQIFTILKLLMIAVLLIFASRMVSYHGYLYDIGFLRTQVSEYHCVEKSLGRSSGLLNTFPRFICFDTIEEADMWMTANSK